MSLKRVAQSRQGQILTIALAISTLLIFAFYFQNRSLFLDSLNLARNIAEGTYADLSVPLNYEQSAPILFLYLTKFVSSILGISEYSLRFVPVLSGIGFLYFYHAALKKLLPIKYVILGVLFLGCHYFFLRYATEFKQYMTDTMVGVLLLWMSLTYTKLDLKEIGIYACIGSFSIWLSMPSVFVLSGVIAYLSIIQYKNNKNITPVAILTIWYGLNFAVEYFLILQPAIESTHMQNFHNHYFLNGKFWDPNALAHDVGLMLSSLRLLVGKSGLAIAVSLILISFGLYDFWKSKKQEAILLITPIIAVFAASLLGKYSLIERLMLFTMPFTLILILFGLQSTLKRLEQQKSWIRYLANGVLALSLLVSFTQTQGLKYLCNPLEIEDNRSALIHIAEHPKKQAPIICTQLAYPAFEYYSKYDINYTHINLEQAIKANYGQNVVQLAQNEINNDSPEVWILMGHMQENEITQLIEKFEKTGTIKNSYRTNKSAAILFSTQ